MKYIVILGDGMGGRPITELGGMTTLEYAKTPVMDGLAGAGLLGMTCNVPEGMSPGSDVANLSVMGYDPAVYYTGRSPLEALSLRIQMEPSDVIFRCNLVTVTEEEPYPQKIITDHSSGEITTEEADQLMDAIREAFNNEAYSFYTGTTYRQIMVWKQGQVLDLWPAHDNLGKPVGPYLPKDPALLSMMERSFHILNNHPVNLDRARRGLNKANSLWFWGAGTKPALTSFEEKTGLEGTVISAVDLLKGIAVGSGMDAPRVEGANGGLHTNYEGKVSAALDALLKEGRDFAYIHVEAPDEMGHQGLVQEKIQAIEYLDSRVVGPVKAAMDASGEDYRMLVIPDHATPIEIRTHNSDPVPFILYDSRRQARRIARYNEKEAAATGVFEPKGHLLMNRLLQED
jgi:2,3-bisphosphoglycerate-independent phosphoglycerate mutase